LSNLIAKYHLKIKSRQQKQATLKLFTNQQLSLVNANILTHVTLYYLVAHCNVHLVVQLLDGCSTKCLIFQWVVARQHW